MLLAALTVFATFAATDSSQRKKARYYYLEGARMQAEGKMPEAYEYYKKAYMADSSYDEAASAYGVNSTHGQDRTHAEQRGAYEVAGDDASICGFLSGRQL